MDYYEDVKKMRSFYLCFLILLIGCTNPELSISDSYYIDSEKGNDNNPGTSGKPLKTITELNKRLQEKPGDIFFRSGQTFHGTIILKKIEATKTRPLSIGPSGRRRAVIDGGNNEAIRIEDCSNLIISDLNLKGNGRKNGNITNGLALIRTYASKIKDLKAEGFQKSGVDVFDCREIEIRNVKAFNNGFSGINIMGSNRESSRKITIKNCKAENNPGDPTRLDNHSGNGILVGISDSVLIEYCTATNNGWDMPRTGNGPVGIWTWESSHVTIQYCLSYGNKTSPGAKDGGGFDLDGGVTNSVIKYCISWENQGAGYGLFQYAGASGWSGNSIRNCLSFNDATTTEGAGSIFIWNGSKDEEQLKDCFLNNNLIINTSAPLISFENDSDHRNFVFSGNVFLGSRKAISGNNTGSSFRTNTWFIAGKGLRFMKKDSPEEW